MVISIFKIFSIFGAVSSWADRALEDGKITLQETVDLAESISKILGIPLEVDFFSAKAETTDPLVTASVESDNDDIVRGPPNIDPSF